MVDGSYVGKDLSNWEHGVLSTLLGKKIVHKVNKHLTAEA